MTRNPTPEGRGVRDGIAGCSTSPLPSGEGSGVGLHEQTNFMRHIHFIFFLSIIAACDQPASQTAVSQQQNAGILRFSKAAAVTELKDMSSWCNRPFTEAVLINAEAANVNRRYFMLGDGVYRIVIQSGNQSSSFFIRKADGKKADVFTSDNFPMCLSNRANFTMRPDGNAFAYDNQRGIHYTVEAQPGSAEIPVFIEFQPEIQYGLTVHRCADCH